MLLAAGLIGMGIGATVGSASYLWSNYKKNSELEKAKDRLKEQRDRNVSYMEAQFKNQQKQAFKSADEADAGSTLAEGLLGTNVSGSLRSLGQSQAQAALNYNLSAINAGGSEGSSLESIAQGGTRGSSAVQAAQMTSDLNAQTLQAQEDADRLNSDVSLASILGSAQEAEYNLQTRRTSAHDTRESYSEGGDAYNLFQQQKANYIADVNTQIDNLSDQQSFWSLDHLTSADGWGKIMNNWLDFTLAGLQGAAAGWNLGTSVGSVAAKAGSGTGSSIPTVAEASGSSTASIPTVASASSIEVPTGDFNPTFDYSLYDFSNASLKDIAPYEYKMPYAFSNASFKNIAPYEFKIKF